MPINNTIREMSRALYDELTKERTIDAATGFELGRLSATLSLLLSAGVPAAIVPRSPRNSGEFHAPIPAPPGASGNTPKRDKQGQFVPTGVKRQRVEKRTMRRPQRVVTGADGHVVVFDFERLLIKDSPPDGDASTHQIASRKEMWDRWHKAKKYFKAIPATA